MRLRYSPILILTWAALLQATCANVYIDPTAAEHTGPAIICGGPVMSVCLEEAPCGPSALSHSLYISISDYCEIFIAAGDWSGSVVVNASGTGATSIHQWDPRGSGDSIRNLALNITSVDNVNVTLSSFNATGSMLYVTYRSLTILDSTFQMDDLNSFLLTDYGSEPLLQINNSVFIKNTGVAPGFYWPIRATSNTLLLSLSNSTFRMPNLDIFQGFAHSVQVDHSILFGDSFISRIYFNLSITHSSFQGFSNGMTKLDGTSVNAPVKYFEARNGTFSGLSSNQPFDLFTKPGPMQSFRVYNSYFKYGKPSSIARPVSSLELQGNTFTDYRLNFNLEFDAILGPTKSIVGNTFANEAPMLQYLVLTSQVFSDIHLAGNRFGDDSPWPLRCELVMGRVHVDQTSNLKLNNLCASGALVEGSLEASHINSHPVQWDPLNITGDVTLSSFTGNVSIFFLNNSLTYHITNASKGIDTLVKQLPKVLNLSWRETRPLKVGDEWPLFPHIDLNTQLPDTLLSDGTFTYSLKTTCTLLSSCALNFTVESVLECPCHPDHSLPCNNAYVYPCVCIPPWSGPTCEIDSSECPSPPPSPQFYCQNGEWVSNSSVTEETIIIPPGAGTVVVNGNLTTTQTVFQGLGSSLNVTGCIFVKGSVVVELTPQDVEELLKERTKTTGLLISSARGGPCDGSTDLSSISINVKSPDKCVKVEATNSGSKQTLAATLSLTQSKCSKSHLVAIIVPSVVGAIVILSIIGVIIVLKIRHDKKL